MSVKNNCVETLNSGGSWSLSANLNCFGQTSLGFYLSGNLPALAPTHSQTTVDQSRQAFCNIYDNGVLVEQTPPTQETYYGMANGSYTLDGIPYEVTAPLATAYLN